MISELQDIQKEKAKEEQREENLRRLREREERERKEREVQEEKKRLEEERREQHIREVTSMELAMDWENFYAHDETTAADHVESISDGFVKCLNRKGCVDIEYIAAISGSDCRSVIENLKGSIYQNPETWGECFYKGWETAEEYLSGNVRRKLGTVKLANEKYHGYFQANIEALKRVIPPRICAEDVYVTLGSPWVPEHFVDDFVEDLRARRNKGSSFNYSYAYNGYRQIRFSYDQETGTWECNNPYYRDWAFDQKYGTSSRTALDIILRTLNLQSVEVRETVRSLTTKSGKQSVVNRTATLEALEKQKLLIREFREW
ncbi:MAG: hypothetical protein K6D90_00405, partial [Lachnospiraceae bacterium]|nr:hypothetical protein [Lachnospiraceae bacterium]